ncbi:FTR1 family protein [Azospirillum sp. TSO22-1]|uniref:FTR1 family iron permease n=1 Tax=Azospirillum sp. TSO22-1 TaxID=716789 RepID=UPI000D60476C|nr:FTR1 family protein [Azospirillum sp. TSO22-1]PWC56360.1 iron permease [Azospirillum sp. TSO22-1]
MLASLIIVFREVLEAGLIIGIVLAATRGVLGRGRWVAAGVGAGVAGACGVAAFADVISDQLDGSGQELFNAAVLLTAVVMLAWHNAWMARHGREHAAEMRAVGRAVESGDRPPHALAVVVGAAVLREGAEVVLFLAGIVSAEGGGGASVALGALGGVALGAVAAFLVYRGLLTIATRHLFSVTSWMITLLAAGMAASAMHYLSQAGLVSFGEAELWDTSFLLSDGSALGQVLHILVGYTDRPTALQAGAWLAVVAGITLLTRLMRPQAPARPIAAE